eukprot:CAMPEP_0185459748 /NCGR_PEP_ID=MMETSP1365-20130426/85615_1 /TAXON_ID=38817 /ORGANISM="Gephyrocapsa oceanica, Strain RCC1303" /LENGTH=52 /DNA_ID=CAMNT_0028066303 /DNA_START=1 /DNA_END=156 /DNA_ORIENTATION=-
MLELLRLAPFREALKRDDFKAHVSALLEEAWRNRLDFVDAEKARLARGLLAE